MFDIKASVQPAGGAVQPGLPPDTDLGGPVLSSLGPPPSRPALPVPLERLEAQLCEVAGHLAAATCRFLVLLAEFDERRGWASWEVGSCAAWLSWRCQMSSGTAREHVRVARALRGLPVIRGEFAAARLSYVKGPGADPDRDPADGGAAGGDGYSDDGEPAGAVRPGAPAVLPR